MYLICVPIIVESFLQILLNIFPKRGGAELTFLLEDACGDTGDADLFFFFKEVTSYLYKAIKFNFNKVKINKVKN